MLIRQGTPLGMVIVQRGHYNALRIRIVYADWLVRTHAFDWLVRTHAFDWLVRTHAFDWLVRTHAFDWLVRTHAFDWLVRTHAFEGFSSLSLQFLSRKNQGPMQYYEYFAVRKFSRLLRRIRILALGFCNCCWFCFSIIGIKHDARCCFNVCEKVQHIFHFIEFCLRMVFTTEIMAFK